MGDTLTHTGSVSIAWPGYSEVVFILLPSLSLGKEENAYSWAPLSSLASLAFYKASTSGLRSNISALQRQAGLG